MTGAVRLSVHCQSVSLCGCRACALSIQSIGLPASLAGRTVLRCSQFGSAGRRRRGRYHTNECSDAGRSVGRTDGRCIPVRLGRPPPTPPPAPQWTASASIFLCAGSSSDDAACLRWSVGSLAGVACVLVLRADGDDAQTHTHTR